MEELNQNNNEGLKISIPSTAFLYETSKWAKFLSILGFIFCGIIVLVAFFAGSIFSSGISESRFPALGAIGGAGITILYILIGVFYFFPCLYLFNFSSKMQAALRSKDQDELDESFKNIKSYFKYLGILTIIVLSFYLLVIIFAVAMAAIVH